MGALADRVRVVLALLEPLGAGSRVLLRCLIGRWGFWWVAGGAGVTVYTVNTHHHWTAWIVAAWCVAAWMHAPDAAKTDAPQSAEPDKTEPTEPHGEAWRAFVVRAIGDRQGVHLRDLLDMLHQTGHHLDWEVADVRRVCEAAGIPVRNRVRVRGLGVTVGIHRNDLPSPSEPSPMRDGQDPTDSELHAA